jgi:orotidine-5'-phosphate decarboxylase
MAHEVISLGADGSIGSEMHGFQGKSCLKAAAEIAKELEALGVMTELSGIKMKDEGGQLVETQASSLKVERG